MGTSAQITVLGGRDGLATEAMWRIRELESRWTRFDPTSELSRLNASGDATPIRVSPETFRLASLSVDAWRRTAGRFDPTILDAVEANGYDRSFDDIPTQRSRCSVAPPTVPGCREIDVDETSQTVLLPAGIRLDPGGIGKGLAADIVAEEAMAAGADGILVDIGGDIRVAGTGPESGRWVIDIEHPIRPNEIALHLAVTDAGVATSSRLRRTWVINDERRHHLLDPATGQPTTSDVMSATVISGAGAWSEALTKVLFVTGLIESITGVSALILHDDGRSTATDDLLALMS